MKVELIAKTEIDFSALSGIGYDVHTVDDFEPLGSAGYFTEQDADELAEFAGRNCYQSFSRPNPATRENRDYLANILEQKHESVLEHASATFYIEASRSVLAELTRHRHLSFSVVSQRYVDATELDWHTPPLVEELNVDGRRDDYYEAARDLNRVALVTYEAYQSLYDTFIQNGFPRKKAREAARAVLPNMTSSPMVVTGNHRAWRDVLKKRWHEAADAEIQEVAGEILRQLRTIAPNTYQDIPETPYV